MSEAAYKLLKANAEASEKHRIAYGKAMYNRGIDDCITKAKLKHDEWEDDASVQSAIYLLIDELEQLKKP